jgi:predicted dehydrogenase
MKKLRWGIISTANIGVKKVIPAMQVGNFCDVTAIASRDPEQAKSTAELLGIPKYYGSYEELLADPEIDAVYIPLPNHLHIPFTIKALEANKHVLCEKPLGMTSDEVLKLQKIASEKPYLKVMEAFMYRFHPQLEKAKQLIAEGAIGTLKNIHSCFSYFNNDPDNIRNKREMGGGGLMDIGCYCISISRYLFNNEPKNVFGIADFDPEFGTDRMVSGMLEFTNGTATFTCSMQLVPFQRATIFGTEGRIELEIPFNAPPDKPTSIWLHNNSGAQEITFDVVDQYTLQGDYFSEAAINQQPVPTSLDDAFLNMKTIEAVFESAASGKKVQL